MMQYKFPIVSGHLYVSGESRNLSVIFVKILDSQLYFSENFPT